MIPADGGRNWDRVRRAGTRRKDGDGARPPLREYVELGGSMATRSLEHYEDRYSADGAARASSAARGSRRVEPAPLLAFMAFGYPSKYIGNS
jgi:hypothetical protein